MRVTTVVEAIERATHALRTGQPNLAILYMRKALAILAAEAAERVRAEVDVWEALFAWARRIAEMGSKPLGPDLRRVAATLSGIAR